MSSNRHTSRKKKKRRMLRKGVPFICVAVLLCCFVVGIRSYMLYNEKVELEKRYEVLSNKLESEEERKTELEEKEKYMGTKKFVEDTAKNKLGLVYPDEIVIQPENK